MNIYKSKLRTHFIYVTFSPFSFKGTVYLKIKCSLFPPACRAFYSSKLLGYTDVLKAPETKPQSQNTVTMFVFGTHDLVTLKIHKRYCEQFKATPSDRITVQKKASIHRDKRLMVVTVSQEVITDGLLLSWATSLASHTFTLADESIEKKEFWQVAAHIKLSEFLLVTRL